MPSKNNQISVAEAAKLLKVSTVRVRTYINEGRLPAQQFGRMFVLQRADVMKFERRQTGRPPKVAK